MNNTNDFIRRGDAIEAVHDRICQIGYERNANVLSIRQAVRDVPAADVVEVMHGQWNGGATGWECSVCTIESNNTYPHCPYCGSVMDGGQDDE